MVALREGKCLVNNHRSVENHVNFSTKYQIGKNWQNTLTTDALWFGQQAIEPFEIQAAPEPGCPFDCPGNSIESAADPLADPHGLKLSGIYLLLPVSGKICITEILRKSAAGMKISRSY